MPETLTLPEPVETACAELMVDTVHTCSANGVPEDEYLLLCDKMKELRAAIADAIREAP